MRPRGPGGGCGNFQNLPERQITNMGERYGRESGPLWNRDCSRVEVCGIKSNTRRGETETKRPMHPTALCQTK